MEPTIKYVDYRIETWNLKNRLDQLPFACFKRFKEKCLESMGSRTFTAILRAENETTSLKNIAAMAEALKCEEGELMNPKHIFKDFRTREEIQQDLIR